MSNEIEIEGPPWTRRVAQALAAVLSSNGFLWLLLAVPLVSAASYVDGSETKFVIMRLAAVVAVIPGWLLLRRAIRFLT